MDLTKWPHVTEEELKCKLCHEIHGEPRTQLLDLFEDIRHALGDHPIAITDGSRCAARQALLQKTHGGAKMSPHVPVLSRAQTVQYFHALDLVPTAPLTGWDVAKAAEQLDVNAGIGVKLYNGSFCHVDVAYLAEKKHWYPGRRW